MKILIEFDCDNEVFVGYNLIPEIRNVLKQADQKVEELVLSRSPENLCTALKSTKKLVDINGNSVGVVTVMKESI